MPQFTIGIITFLIGFFSVWLIGLIRYWRWLRMERIQIENCKNIQPLVTARHEQDRGNEDNDQKVDPENAFSEFCKESSLNRRSPIAKHLKAIFLAGWDETRLEVGELINHTTADLFKWNNLFRSMLAVFIVIGLFGTLFGLADSITGLSLENNEKMTIALEDLLNKMKGALAPSISGIFFTILGVILYGIYLQYACHPVKYDLERLTLTVWVPQLYPTTSQKLMQTLQKSESQMQKGFDTAAQFSDSVQKVHRNIDEFNNSLSQVREITQPLSDSVTQINKAASDISTAAGTLNTGFTENLDKFSKEFTSSVTHLTGFQDEIRNLHEQFQDAANQKLNQFQDAANQKLDLQTEKLDEQNQNISKFTKTLETNLSNLQKSLNGRLDTLNDRLENFDTPLRDAVDHISKTFDTQLETLNNRLENFDEPLQEAAEHMRGTFADLVRYMQNIVGDLQKEIREQNEKYEEQLNGVKDLNQEIVTLLNRLDESSKNQQNAVNELSGNVVELTEDINNLDTAINSLTSDSGDLSQSVGAIKGDIEKLGRASQQFVEIVKNADVKPLTVSIDKLNTSINEISQNSKTLANAVDRLARQDAASGSGQKTKSSDSKRIWNSIPRIWPFKKTTSETKNENEGK